METSERDFVEALALAVGEDTKLKDYLRVVLGEGDKKDGE